MNANQDLMTPSEVANMLRVDPKTVTRWARSGVLGTAVRTPGGHRRYRRADLVGLFADAADIPAGPQPAGMPSQNEIVLTREDVEIIRAGLLAIRMTGRLRLRSQLEDLPPGTVIRVMGE